MILDGVACALNAWRGGGRARGGGGGNDLKTLYESLYKSNCKQFHSFSSSVPFITHGARGGGRQQLEWHGNARVQALVISIAVLRQGTSCAIPQFRAWPRLGSEHTAIFRLSCFRAPQDGASCGGNGWDATHRTSWSFRVMFCCWLHGCVSMHLSCKFYGTNHCDEGLNHVSFMEQITAMSA